MLREYAAADLGGVGRGRDDGGAEGAYDFAAERFLLVGAFDHKYLAVKPEVAAGHRKGGAPLPGACFGGYSFEALLFGIICLSDGRVELMRAGGVVAFEFVEYFGGSTEGFLKEGGMHQGRRAVHLVEIEHLIGDFNEACGVV